MVDRQVCCAATPQAPGLPLDEPATDTEVLLGVAALLTGARARHDSDCFPVSVDERRLAPRLGQARFQRHHFHSPSIAATLKSGLRPRLGGCVSGPRTTAAACAGDSPPRHTALVAPVLGREWADWPMDNRPQVKKASLCMAPMGRESCESGAGVLSGD